MDYFQYQEAILDLDETPQTKIVAIVIASHYNWKKKEHAFPSNSTIANKASLSIKTVIKAKNRLVELGYLTSQQRFNSTNVYSPTLPTVTGTVPAVAEGNRGVSQGKPNNEVNKELNKEKNNENVSNETLVSSINILPEEVEDITMISLDTNRSPLAEVTASPAAAQIIEEDWLSW
jgi:DNA-binding transcriptional MocR family regulator